MKLSGQIFLRGLVLFMIICSVSCSGRKSRAEHRHIIPEKDLISILTEIHIADGVLSIPRISNLYVTADSMAAYINVIERHGYTKETMDRTMWFYFSRKPKELIRIYDKVLGALSAMESKLLQYNPLLEDAANNYWQGKQFYYFYGGSPPDSAEFDLPVQYSRFYTLNFTITVYPDDETQDPHLNMFFEANDPAVKAIKRTSFPGIFYPKDGRPHNFSIPIRLKEMPPIRIKGWFVNMENQNPLLKSHYYVENISLNPRLPGQ